MKKIIFIFAALLLTASVTSCSDDEFDKLKSTNADLNAKIKQQQNMAKSTDKPDNTSDIVNMHELEKYAADINYNNKKASVDGYLVDDSSYVFRLDDVANHFGLDVYIDEATGAISINGNVNINTTANSLSSINTANAGVDDRYSSAAIMNLVKNGEITLAVPTNTPKLTAPPASYNSSSGRSSQGNSSSGTAKNGSSGSTMTSAPSPTATPVNKDYPFDFSEKTVKVPETKAKDDEDILKNFGLYHEVASKFYSRFSEVPNLTWANSSVSAVQISNHNDNATYWYYIPEGSKNSLESSYVTILSEFGYEYAGSLNNQHTYTLGANRVSFGYDGNDFMVTMSGNAECGVGDEYVNGFKSAGLTNFGKRFNIDCIEETMYYGDWVYCYPADSVERANAVPMYISELEKDGFIYTGTQDGRSTYSNGNIIVGTRTVDDNFYLSIVKK